MINGAHAIVYSRDSEADRTFFRDILGLPHVDVGQGWLIFDFAEGDLGFHPTEGQPPSGTHEISFYCDDLEGPVGELKSRGVEFTQEIEDHGYGLVTYFKMPGDVKVQLYQPRYTKNPSH